MARLAAHETKPLDILTETVALFLFSKWSPRSLPDDTRLTWAIGSQVLKLCRLGTRYGGYFGGKHRLRSKLLTKTARRDVGRKLRFTLAPLLANVADAIEAEDGEHQRFLVDILRPF